VQRGIAAKSGHHLFKYAPAIHSNNSNNNNNKSNSNSNNSEATTTFKVARLTIQFICNIKI